MFAQKGFLAAIVAAPAALLALGGVAHATMPGGTIELRSATDGIGERATVQRVAAHRNCRSEGGRRVCGSERGSYPLTTKFGFATGGDPNKGPSHPVYRPGSLWTPTPTLFPFTTPGFATLPLTTPFGFATGDNLRTFLHPSAPPPSSSFTTGSVPLPATVREAFPNTLGGHLRSIGVSPSMGGSRSIGGSRSMGGGSLSGGSHGGGGGLH